jgi:FkbM family methyltransferase
MATMTPGASLFSDMQMILGRDPAIVLDVGAQYGQTSANYLEAYPQCKIFAFEPATGNFRQGRNNLARFGDRVELIASAITDVTGQVGLNLNSHDGTHSIFKVGDQRYWDGYAEEMDTQTVQSVSLDDFCRERSIRHIDLLHMDIQGAELLALRGAEKLLAGHCIDLVYCEVEFFELYRNQPIFWEIGAHLQTRGYHLYSLYDRHYHKNNARVLAWADALFISQRWLDLPAHPKSSAPYYGGGMNS